jgi:hypothetical protein
LNATHDPVKLRWTRTAISKWIRRQSLNGTFILLISLSGGILIVLQISLFESFPQGLRENTARTRVQTAAKGVNGFVKATPLRKIMTYRDRLFREFDNAEKCCTE